MVVVVNLSDSVRRATFCTHWHFIIVIVIMMVDIVLSSNYSRFKDANKCCLFPPRVVQILDAGIGFTQKAE